MEIVRWLRHALITPAAVRRAFTAPVLARIERAIADGETRHTGEVRFAVEPSLPWSYLQRDAPARQRAEMLFAKLRVWDTALNNGVLLYVLMADHRIEIVADRGISACVAPERWQEIAEQMRACFARGEFEAGAVAGVEAVSALLAEHCPEAPGERGDNALPDAPVLV